MSAERKYYYKKAIARIAELHDIDYGRGALEPLVDLLESLRKRLVKIVKRVETEDEAIEKSGVHHVFHAGILYFGTINYTGKDWGNQFINNTLQTVAIIILSDADQETRTGVISAEDIKSTALYKTLVKKLAKKPAKPAVKKVVKKAPKKAVKKAPKKAARGYEAMTVVQLRAKAKERGLSGYSRLNKSELVKLLRGKKPAKKPSRKPAKKAKKPTRKPTVKKEMTVVALRALCKKKGIKGYSRLNKAELIKLCKK